jgi:iron complex outermembrane receptor protein
LAFRGGYNARRKAYPTAAYDTVFDDPGAWVRDRHVFADATWDNLQVAGWSTRVKAAYDGYQYVGSYPYDDDGDPATAGAPWRERGFGDWLTGEAQFSRTIDARHRVTVGLEHRQHLRQRQDNYSDNASEPLWQDDRHSAATGAYAQDEFRLHSRLLLNAGVRVDRYAGSHAAKPRIALVYEPGQRTSYKLVAGAAFRAPNVFERYYEASGYRANPTVTPETMNSVEAIAEKYVGRAFRVTGSVFTSRVSHLIALTADQDGTFSYENVDANRVFGVEGELEAKSSAGAQIRASYMFADACDRATDEWLTNSPRHIAQLVASAPLHRSLIAALDVRALSGRLTRTRTALAGYTVANVSLSAPFAHQRATLSLTVSNAFDSAFADPVDDGFVQEAIAQRGRTVRLRASYRF